MANFGSKPYVNSFGKMSILRSFELLVFIAQKGGFSLQNIVKDIFLAYIALKKMLQEWPILVQNHMLTRLEKCQFFDFLNILFLQTRKAFFWFQNIVRHFPGLYCLKTKRLEKWPFFGPRPWVNPFGKMSIFRIFKLFVFIAQKGVFFFFQNIVKDIFLAQIA